MLILPDDSTDLVDPRLADAEILSRYDLDEIVRVPEIEFCTGLYLDDPECRPNSVLSNQTRHLTAQADRMSTKQPGAWCSPG